MTNFHLLNRTITELDEVRLQNLLRRQFGSNPPPFAQALLDVLDYAEVVTPQAVPANVITMSSQLTLQMPDGEARELTLVYPEEADAQAACISILSPVGAALLGARVGDAIAWQGAGTAQLTALRFQPEAAGDYTI